MIQAREAHPTIIGSFRGATLGVAVLEISSLSARAPELILTRSRTGRAWSFAVTVTLVPVG
jgi:hypothetical protein